MNSGDLSNKPSGLERPILLTGMPGCGKSSTVYWLKRFVENSVDDLDDLYTLSYGKSPAEAITEEGEAEFRRNERTLLESLLSVPNAPAVLACGGGTLTDPETLESARKRALVVFLYCELDELARRLGDGAGRPLLGTGPLNERLWQLWLKREELYRRADITMDVTRMNPAEIAWSLANSASLSPSDGTAFNQTPGRLGRITAGDSVSLVTLADRRAREVLAELFVRLRPGVHRILVLDDGMDPEHQALLADAVGPSGVMRVRGGESAKHIDRLPGYLAQFRELGAHRGSLVVIGGGGSVLDGVGMAASLYMRGVRTLLVPTTLLAAVDASIGGKTAMDVGGAKNLCGSFHLPTAVFIPLPWLTLPSEAARRAAAGEILKVAILAGNRTLASHASNLPNVGYPVGRVLVAQALRCKMRCLAGDLLDQSGNRACLNLGHTFGHALEAALSFTRSHGECVGAGIVVAARLSRFLGLAPKKEALSWEALAVRTGLWPVPDLPPIPDLVRAMLTDKKQGTNSITWVLLRGWGDPVLKPVPKGDVENLLTAVL